MAVERMDNTGILVEDLEGTPAQPDSVNRPPAARSCA